MSEMTSHKREMNLLESIKYIKGKEMTKKIIKEMVKAFEKNNKENIGGQIVYNKNIKLLGMETTSTGSWTTLLVPVKERNNSYSLWTIGVGVDTNGKILTEVFETTDSDIKTKKRVNEILNNYKLEIEEYNCSYRVIARIKIS